jgi:serine protease inhibitor
VLDNIFGAWVIRAFQSLIATHYDAALYRLDLANQPQQASKIVNQWANKNTLGMIKEPVPQDFFVNQRHKIALTNCVYFEDKWLYPFNLANTKTEKFWVTTKKAVDVQMMHGEGTFGYAKADDMEILEIPYAGMQHSLMVVLPPGEQPLMQMEDQLSKWIEWRKRCTQNIVELAMPKLNLNGDNHLRTAMYNLGLQRCGFSRIGNVGEINTILQTAKLQIDEEGSKFAAFTMLAKGVSAGSFKLTVRLDRPHWLLLLDRQTDSILMIAGVQDPTRE